MEEELLANIHTPHSSTNQSHYDPFNNPPNFILAETHAKATSVGIAKADNNFAQQICPCCDNPTEKQQISLCFKDEELNFLGVGYPLYYKLTRYFSLILIIIFVISGSALYFFVTIECKQNCIKFFNITIMNLDVTHEESLKRTELVNLLTCLGIFTLILFLKTKINDDIRNLWQNRPCPSLYTIMLQNIPPNSSEKQLFQWIQQTFQHPALTINWAYNVDQLKDAYKHKQSASISLNQINIQLKKYRQRQAKHPENAVLNQLKKNQQTNQKLQRKAQELSQNIQTLNQVLNSYKQMDKECQKVGTAFVTFQSISTVNKILDEYQCSFLNSFLKNLMSVIKKSRLSFNNQILIVNRAPAPKEVIWRNLQFSYIRNIGFECMFIICMTIMILMAFRLQFYFVSYAYSLKVEGRATGKFIVIIQAIAMSMIILILNSLMRLIIQYFTFAKKYYSFTKYQGSFCLYYSLLYIINSCFMVYIVHGQYIDDSKELLLIDIHLIMISNAFSEPLYKIFEPTTWGRYFYRLYIRKYLKMQQNPYTQEYINQLWEGSSISNADNYQYITRVLFITTWFAHFAPIGVIASLVGLFLDYWVSKYLLVRVYKTPENISQDIALPSIMSLELLPLVYICGVLQFTYKVSSSPDLFAFVTEFFNYGVTTLVILLCIIGYLLFCKKIIKKENNTPYSSAKLQFYSNYQSTNPITKLRGDLNYLYQILKSHKSTEEDQEIIANLLKISKSQTNAIYEQKNAMQISRIKRKLFKRISHEHEEEMMEFSRRADPSKMENSRFKE